MQSQAALESARTYTLKNDHYTIAVNSFGAELKSFTYQNEEYLYAGDTKYWGKSSPVLFPIVGKLKDNSYTYQGKDYSLPIHGLARDNLFSLVHQSENELAFRLRHSSQSLSIYPFSFELTLTYRLKADRLVINYQVSSSEDILFSLGAHPAFLLKAEIDDSYIKFSESENSNSLALDIPSGCISDQSLVRLNSNQLDLHQRIFEKDAVIFKDVNSNEVSLHNTVNKKSVSVKFDGFEYIAFWAPLDAPFVCIEPWCGIADHVDSNQKLEDKPAIIKLNKDQIFSRSLEISIV